jgi:hypothetical protein
MASFKGEKRYLPRAIEGKPTGKGDTVVHLSRDGLTRPARRTVPVELAIRGGLNSKVLRRRIWNVEILRSGSGSQGLAQFDRVDDLFAPGEQRHGFAVESSDADYGGPRDDSRIGSEELVKFWPRRASRSATRC